MRKKKNLQQRLEACADLLIELQIDELDINAYNNRCDFLDTVEIFGNDHPVVLEIGCGKGQFAREYAVKNPSINIIAVEKTSNVIVTACEKTAECGIKNLRFINCGAEYLSAFIAPNSISSVFLNFSCPYPKKKYENHRLTGQRFLRFYKSVLKDDAGIFQKTDNMHFFEYSIEQLSIGGFIIKNISLDLHNSDFEGNIVTEYEQHFSKLGKPIYRLEAYKK